MPRSCRNPPAAWMWAHGQLLDADTVPGDPARSLSRLVSSRKLEPNRRYLACVVPVFAAGKAAGLGTDPGDARTSMDFAWDPAGGEVTLPVYYFWRFGTGPDGDFEALVRRLHGVPLPGQTRQAAADPRLPHDRIAAPDPDGAAVELQVCPASARWANGRHPAAGRHQLSRCAPIAPGRRGI